MPFKKGYIPWNKGKKMIYKNGNPRIGNSPSLETRAKQRKSMLGKKHSEETKRKISKAHIGMKVSKKVKKKISRAKRGKKPSLSRGAREKRRERFMGEKNPRWKGGITPINEKIRRTLEYKLWRIAVFERDNYTCIWCGQRGGELHADHIKPFALFPELRFAIDNGRTLCKKCHRTTRTYGEKL